MTVLYEYRLSGRRPAIWLSGAALIITGALMATYNVTIIFWVPVVAGVLLIAWSQISMRPKGLRITEDNLILSPWTSPQSIPLDDIESIQCGSPDDSAGLQVRMRSGRIFKISRLDSPPVATLRTILADIAIPVKQS